MLPGCRGPGAFLQREKEMETEMDDTKDDAFGDRTDQDIANTLMGVLRDQPELLAPMRAGAREAYPLHGRGFVMVAFGDAAEDGSGAAIRYCSPPQDLDGTEERPEDGPFGWAVQRMVDRYDPAQEMVVVVAVEIRDAGGYLADIFPLAA